MKVKVEVSSRHVHLTKKTYEILFGDTNITPIKALSIDGEYVTDKKVTLVTGVGFIKGVSVLGGFRDKDQVEVMPSDMDRLGSIYSLQRRMSGDLYGTPPITLIGSHGAVTIKRGLIAAKRHAHTALAYTGIGSVRIKSLNGLWINDIVVRECVQGMAADMIVHIDRDEAEKYCVPRDGFEFTV